MIPTQHTQSQLLRKQFQSTIQDALHDLKCQKQKVKEAHDHLRREQLRLKETERQVDALRQEIEVINDEKLELVQVLSFEAKKNQGLVCEVEKHNKMMAEERKKLKRCEDIIKQETLKTIEAREVYARNFLQINAASYRAMRSCKEFIRLDVSKLQEEKSHKDSELSALMLENQKLSEALSKKMSELDELKKESSVLEAERQSEGAQAEEDDQEIADLEAKLQSLLDECEVVETKTRTIQDFLRGSGR